MIRCYNYLLIAAFSLETLALISLKNDQTLDKKIHSSLEKPQNNIGGVHDIPEFLVKTYLKNTKDDGTLKGSSKQIIPTVHGFIGQGNARFLNCFNV